MRKLLVWWTPVQGYLGILAASAGAGWLEGPAAGLLALGGLLVLDVWRPWARGAEGRG